MMAQRRVSFAAVFCLGLAVECLGNDAAHVVFDCDRVVSAVPRYGANMTHKDGSARFLDGAYDLRTDKVVGGLASGTQVVRFPGGTIANTYRWKDAIGPQAGRIDQVHGWNTSSGGLSSAWGPDEAAQYAETIGGELMMVVTINDTASSAADLVEYMNCAVGENPNGGTDWAAVRAANGHAEPYGVRYWEIGNESGGKSLRTWPSWPLAGDDNLNDGMVQNTEQAKNWWTSGGYKSFTNQKAVRYSDWGETGPDPLDDTVVKSAGAAWETFYAKFPRIDQLAELRVGTSLASSTVWTETTNLQNHGANDQVFRYQKWDGKIWFGDGVHGKIPPAGSYVFISYTTGRRDGYIAFYNQMKAVDPDIVVVNSHYKLLSKYSAIIAGGAAMDGYQVHAADESYAPPPAGADYLDQLLGCAYFGLPKKLKDGADGLRANGWPAGTKMVVSEYGFGSSYDSALRLAHGQTIVGALAQVAAFRQTVMGFGSTTDYPVETMQMNYLDSGGAGLMVSDGAVTGAGLAQYLITRCFGSHVLAATTVRMPLRPLVWQGLNWQDVQQNESLPKVVLVGAKDSAGNLYVMAANTTSTETIAVTADLDNATGLPGSAVASWTLSADSIVALNKSSNTNNIRIVFENNPADVAALDADTLSFPAAPLQIRVVKILSPDSDGDGMPDAWEMQYFGGLSQVASSDWDGDGMDNIAEYVSGSNPANALSQFRADALPLSNGDFQLGWNTVSGRVYSVYGTPDLRQPFSLIQANLPCTQTSYAPDPGQSTNRFFRIRVQLQ